MASPHLFLLGAPKFELNRKPVTLGAAKAVALLGYLAATGELQSRERLLGLLWSESSEDAARKNLRNTLWSIRKALGDDILNAGDDHLSIDKSTWVDVREFEKLSTPTAQDPEPAIRLYRGNLLEGIEIADAPEFEIWLTGVRERLAQLYSRALSTQVESLRARGDWHGVIDIAHRALAHDNLQEPMYRALMEAHARLGERGEALRHYDTLQSTLERELGVEPLPESKSLRTAILKGSILPVDVTAAVPATRPVAVGEQAAPEATSVSKLPSTFTPGAPFIGRRAELLLLDRELEMAKGGHARIALLTGEVGIGKSRLWREWSGMVGSEVTVLEARSLDSTQTLPLAPLAEMFRHPVLAQRLFQPSTPVSPIWLAEVARLLPELRASLPNLPTPAALPPDEERRRLFESFTQCLLALGGRPLVLHFDDIHWADRATLDWLDYLLHRLRDRSLLLVAAYRPEDAAGPLVHLLAGWGREGLVQKIPLARLTPAESAALVASLGGNPDVADKVQAQSAGNPFFLIELYRAAPTDIPPVLSELVRVRLDRLPGTAQQVLQAASVLQPDFDFATLRRTSGRSEEETLEALDALLDASVVAERDGHYVFTHPLIPAVVAGGLSGARRSFIHRRAAEALQVTNAGRLAEVAGALTGHYEQAGDTTHAAHFAEMAAEHALELAASAEAIAFYRQALALEPTPARQMGLGRVLLRQAELEEARAAFESALRGFEAVGDRRSAARAALKISETFYPSGKFEEGRQWIVKGMDLTEGENDLESDALAHIALGSAQLGDPKTIVEGEKNLREAVRRAEEGQLPDLAARASFSLGNLLAERGDLDRALNAYAETIRFAELAGNDFQEALGHNNLAYHAMLLGDLATAHAELQAGLALAEAHALRLPLQHLYSTRGEIALAEQMWNQAEEWFQRALVESEKNSNPREIANDRANLGLAARGRGDLDGAVMLLESARDSAARLTDAHLQIKIHLWLAELYLQRGERAAARESLAQARQRLKGIARKRLSEWADELDGKLHAAG